MHADLMFHDALRDLVPGRDHGPLCYPVDRRASVKDVIEALGVPHTEVGRILEAGIEVDFHALLAAKRYDVFPVAAPWDVTAASVLRPEPLVKLRFLVDENVHRLTGLLRMIGINAAGCPGMADADIARHAAAQGRVVLSKDRRLLRRKQIVFGRLVHSVHPWDQLREIVDLFGLKSRMHPFSRCIHCNLLLVPRPKVEIQNRLEPLTRKYYQVFQECPKCQRIYWPGSHHDRMRERLRALGISD
ncbi:MAG TPA: hypothetical protein ENN39_05310 [Desulfonatronum sp.]|nr:hypothetical protein [Desulfonatronum sp.]